MNPGNCVFLVNRVLLQVVGVADERLVHALLHPTPRSGSRIHQKLTHPNDRTTRPYKPRAHIIVPPTLYVLNAAALTKPNAIEHLAADMRGYQIDVSINDADVNLISSYPPIPP